MNWRLPASPLSWAHRIVLRETGHDELSSRDHAPRRRVIFVLPGLASGWFCPFYLVGHSLVFSKLYFDKEKSIMSKQQGKLQRMHLTFEGIGETITTFRIVASAGIAISVIIMQAYIGTGITDGYIFISVIAFAIAIPVLTLYMLIISTVPRPRSNITRTVLYVVFIIGACACASGVMSAFLHLSRLVGYVFMTASIISIVLALLMRTLEDPQDLSEWGKHFLV